MGPTILIQPSVLRKIFAEAAASSTITSTWCGWIRSGAASSKMAPASISWTTPARWLPALKPAGPAWARSYKQLMGLSEELHDISDRFFFWKSVGSMMDTWMSAERST